MFVYQSDIFNEFTFAGQTIQIEIIENESPMSNLTLMVFKKDNGYRLSFQYRGDLYERETLQRFADMMINVLRGLLANTRLRDIALTDGTLPIGTHSKVIPYDGKTIVDIFRAQAAAHKDKTAVVYDEKQLSYGELDVLSTALAKRLVKMGVRAETPVAIMISRSEWFPVCALGVLKAGGAYQPLDPSYPAERLQYMIGDSKAPILIYDENLAGLIPDYKGETILTRSIAAMQGDEKVLLPVIKPEDLFILLYTSGSTGLPKGCMLTHRNIADFCLRCNRRYQVTQNDRACAYASFGFDACMMDFYPYLTTGGSVYYCLRI